MRTTKLGVEFEVKDNPFWKNHFEQGWENSTFDFLKRHWDPHKIFLDIGAWIGPMSLVGAHFSYLTLSFEPDKTAYREFSENIFRNNLEEKIITLPHAVSIFPEISLGNSNPGDSMTRDSSEENVRKVVCNTPEEIFTFINDHFSNREVSVIKIDIEGHETELLKDRFLWELNIPMHISLHPGWKPEGFYEAVEPFFLHKGVKDYRQEGNFYDVTIEKK